MEIENISRENVKPSSPTPCHLKTYQLSMLDQLVPPMLVPLVLCFTLETNPITLSLSSKLKRSLSVVLSRFYPLAGRVSNDGRSVDCNDEGVPFVVVKFPGKRLSDLIRESDTNLPRRLLPCEVNIVSEEGPRSSVLMIQLNYFACGSFAIGAVFWHKIADAAAISTFLKSWAAVTRGGGQDDAITPNYIAQYLFPYKEEFPSQSVSLAGILKTGKSVMRRYVFDGKGISSLKAESGIETPSSVEVVSALLWKCFMAASLMHGNSTSLLTHAVNLRRRAWPPFSSDCFGNFPGIAVAVSGNDNGIDFGNLVSKIRDGLRKIDGDYVNRMMGDDGLKGHNENARAIWGELPAGADLLSISSWCGFGLYNVDFGWGRPVWLTRCDGGNNSPAPFLNTVWLMDTRSRDGIEAWVTLEESYMSVFDNVDELRDHAYGVPKEIPSYSGAEGQGAKSNTFNLAPHDSKIYPCMLSQITIPCLASSPKPD